VHRHAEYLQSQQHIEVVERRGTDQDKANKKGRPNQCQTISPQTSSEKPDQRARPSEPARGNGSNAPLLKNATVLIPSLRPRQIATELRKKRLQVKLFIDT
jgi:hypothetical protein